MHPKRILILTNRIPYPLNDGGNMATHAMIEGYREQGWEIYLLAMHTTRHTVANNVLEDLYKDLYAFETIAVNNNITVLGTLQNLLFSSLPNHAARFYTHSFSNKLADVINEFKPDVVQLESVFLSTYLPVIKQSKAFTVLRLHNIEGQVWQRLAYQTKNYLKKLYLNNLATRIKGYEAKVWGAYDLLLPITDMDAAVVKAICPAVNLLTMPFGIDINKDETVSRVEEWVGYHIGAMDWLPNREAINWFIKHAWPRIIKQSPGFLFYFAGRNMPQAFKDIKVEGVKCLGEVADASAFIEGKKILIVPLHSGGGIRVKILEAMAAGKLVISTGIGMQGIDATPFVHYLQADDGKTFADAISWLLVNRDKANDICQNAIMLVEEKYNKTKLAVSLSAEIKNRLEHIN